MKTCMLKNSFGEESEFTNVITNMLQKAKFDQLYNEVRLQNKSFNIQKILGGIYF